jgi:hypothetical protein
MGLHPKGKLLALPEIIILVGSENALAHSNWPNDNVANDTA